MPYLKTKDQTYEKWGLRESCGHDASVHSGVGRFCWVQEHGYLSHVAKNLENLTSEPGHREGNKLHESSGVW
ncbi:hypothetical protein PHISP_03258 [Aspergillus sp. HF37]|nr:hypothetical protein PHISP_03258 [Aspergillus sp. HF37]